MGISPVLRAEKREEVPAVTPWFFDMLAICNWFFRISVFNNVCDGGEGKEGECGGEGEKDGGREIGKIHCISQRA